MSKLPTSFEEDVAWEILAELCKPEHGEKQFVAIVAPILTRYREQAVAPLREALEKIKRHDTHSEYGDTVYGRCGYIARQALAAHQPKKDNHNG